MYLKELSQLEGLHDRQMYVPDDPEIITSVPAPPEARSGVVIRHAPHHILRCVDAVGKSPQTEETPRDQELDRDQR